MMKNISFILLLLGFGLMNPIIAQENFSILVSGGGEGTVTISRDEPLVIRVVLVNRQAQSAAHWNLAAKQRLGELEQLRSHQKISDSVYESEKQFVQSQMRVEQISTIGSSAQPWTGMLSWTIRSADRSRTYTWSLKLLSNPKPVQVAVMDADAFYTAYYGIDPELMNQAADGKYIIEGKIGNVSSDPVTVVVDRRPGGSDTIKHLSLLAKYYWHKGDGDRSLRFAEMILQQKPRLISGLLMKADALCLNRSLLPALEIYNLALEEYYKMAGASAEPPDYIMDMIGAIKNELGGN